MDTIIKNIIIIQSLTVLNLISGLKNITLSLT